MSTSKTLHDDTVLVPETDEVDWGAEVSAFLQTLIEDANSAIYQDADGNVFNRIQWTTATIADAGTLTPATTGYRLSGDVGAVTLDVTTAITDGEIDGQLLIIKGTSDTNTVTINDAANTDMNGQIILGDGDVIRFSWDSTSSAWIELSRNS